MTKFYLQVEIEPEGKWDLEKLAAEVYPNPVYLMSPELFETVKVSRVSVNPF